MAKFKEYHQNQIMLMPHSLEEKDKVRHTSQTYDYDVAARRNGI